MGGLISLVMAALGSIIFITTIISFYKLADFCVKGITVFILLLLVVSIFTRASKQSLCSYLMEKDN